MANKLMQDVNEIESSSHTESEGPDNVAADEERMKKEEIMANLKQLNLLQSADPGVMSPS